jgi:defect in organelle trafficking protein DotB
MANVDTLELNPSVIATEASPVQPKITLKWPYGELQGLAVDDFLQWLVDNGGFNDLYLMTGYPVFARIQGEVVRLLDISLSKDLVEVVSRKISDNDQIESAIVAGEQFDGVYVLQDQNKRGVAHRFRINIKGIRSYGGGRGVGVTIRQVSVQAPTVKQLGVEDEILDSFLPRNGLVLVSGPTGSGKSTLFASVIGHIAQTSKRHMVIGTCEEPIEYVFDHVDMKNVVIYQSSIGGFGSDIKTFDLGVRASLRSGTNATVIGELRDLDTIRAAMTASNTGQVVWGTLHVNSIVDIPGRVINVFPSEEMNKVRVEFYSNIRFMMCQILVPSIVPGQARVPMKEWLRITPDMRRQLINAPLKEEAKLLQKFLDENGMPMAKYARAKYEQGIIDEEAYNFVCEGE